MWKASRKSSLSSMARASRN
nr:unnamed protein product [Callosobruchus chinensis]